MKNTGIKVLFLIISLSLFSQSKSMVIKDSITLNGIPLATVEYLNSNSGTFSDELGITNIDDSIDSIKVSCIGYIDKITLISKIDSVILLKPKAEKLEEVVLNSESEEFKEIKKIRSKQKVNFTTNTSGFIFARKFKVTKKSYLIKIKADIENDSIQKKIILKFYKEGEDGMPSDEISKAHYYSAIEPNQKYLDIDLLNETIALDKGEVYIALVIVSEKSNAKIKFGMNRSKNSDSYMKPYFNKKTNWMDFSILKGKYYSNFNFSILLK